MADDDWKRTYDEWKLRTPPEYECDDPPSRQDPGECERCRGSGWIVVNRLGRYIAAGPVPDYSRSRFVFDEPCDGCGGSGVIPDPEADE
jgi:DnaJ-class molecular chaperone